MKGGEPHESDADEVEVYAGGFVRTPFDNLFMEFDWWAGLYIT
jgi:hypothetical protein